MTAGRSMVSLAEDYLAERRALDSTWAFRATRSPPSLASSTRRVTPDR